MHNQQALKVPQNTTMGLVYLLLNLLISVSAQFLLKAGMLELGSFQGQEATLTYLLSMINWKIVGGLFFYASGIVFWLLCLSKLDLSFAYPAATFQYVLIFVGSWYFFDEQVGIMRVLGMLIISLGVIIISLDYRKT